MTPAQAALTGLLLLAFAGFRPAAQEPTPPQAWPGWGGARGDFSFAGDAVPGPWRGVRPLVRWRRELGHGYSAIVTDGGWLYASYAAGEEEAVAALDPATGATRWEFLYRPEQRARARARPDGGPRSTPLLLGDRVIAVGEFSDVVCLDRRDGRLLWRVNLWNRFGGNALIYGYSSSPVRFEKLLIMPVGGPEASIVALDLEAGETAWRTPGFQNGYSTPTVVRIRGKDQLVVFMETELVSVDPRTGAHRWTYPLRGSNIARPIWHGTSGTLFLSSSGKRAGARGLAAPRETRVDERWSNPSMHVYYTNLVRFGDLAIGSSAEPDGYFLVAMDMATGGIRWRVPGLASSTLAVAGPRLLVLEETGELSVATMTGQGLTLHSTSEVASYPARTPPTVVGSSVYVRDRTHVTALDLRTRPQPSQARRPSLLNVAECQ